MYMSSVEERERSLWCSLIMKGGSVLEVGFRLLVGVAEIILQKNKTIVWLGIRLGFKFAKLMSIESYAFLIIFLLKKGTPTFIFYIKTPIIFH